MKQSEQFRACMSETSQLRFPMVSTASTGARVSRVSNILCGTRHLGFLGFGVAAAGSKFGT